jgi:NADPH:quinone reductase-like Zn-dependent oxidoreductase
MSSQTSEAYQIWLNDKSRDHLSPTYLSNLVLVTVPKPVPGPGEVLVRIRAAALNYRDLLVLVNSPRYPAVTKSGLVPVADGSGTIESVGPDSTWASSIGEGVILVSNRGWIDGDDPTQYTITGTLGAGDYDGTLRQYAVVKDELLIKKPKNLSFEEAAAIVAASGTAIHVLDAVDVIRGTTVLTQGTGGVSSFVIQVRFSHSHRYDIMLTDPIVACLSTRSSRHCYFIFRREASGCQTNWGI